MPASGFWTRDVDGAAVQRLCRGLGVHAVTARCLVGRGVSGEDDARSFLSPRLGGLRRPEGLAGLEPALDRLERAIAAGERIGIFGDYDADGVTTAALLSRFLRALGAPCTPRVARRDAGYGFRREDAAALRDAGCTTAVIGDCGTSDVEAVAEARSLGLDVIVIDHHAVPGDVAGHPARALINPLRADSTFPFRGMASVGLAFYVCAALRTRVAARRPAADLPDPRDLLDLVALGTIADVVPLTRENRILTAQGLKALTGRARPGARALLAAAGVREDEPVDERTVAWKLAPRLNAPGRLGDATPALSVLLADDPAEAKAAAAAVEAENDKRRAAQERVVAEARELARARAEESAIVVAGEGWPSGVVGIAAAKLCEEFGVPAFVLTIDRERGEARGSGRSVPGVDLVRVLGRCRDALVRYGGHEGAAGLTAEAHRVGDVTEALAAAVSAEGGGGARGDDPADAEIPLDDVSEGLVRELEGLAPFGRENAEPSLLSRGLRVRSSRRVGDGSHLKLVLEGREAAFGAIGFGLGERDPGPGAEIDAMYAPAVSTWGGGRRIELVLRDLDRGKP